VAQPGAAARKRRPRPFAPAGGIGATVLSKEGDFLFRAGHSWPFRVKSSKVSVWIAMAHDRPRVGKPSDTRNTSTFNGKTGAENAVWCRGWAWRGRAEVLARSGRLKPGRPSHGGGEGASRENHSADTVGLSNAGRQERAGPAVGPSRCSTEQAVSSGCFDWVLERPEKKNKLSAWRGRA